MSAEGNLPAPSPSSGPASRAKSGGALVPILMSAFVAAAVGFGAGYILGARTIIRLVYASDRSGVAYILNGRCATGICQTLWVGRDIRSARVVESLSGQAEEADEIAWTPDGARVAFIVNGYQLRLFDARSGANLGATTLVEPDASPTSRIARGVTFSNNGAALTFDDCPRDHSGCRPGMVAIKH